MHVEKKGESSFPSKFVISTQGLSFRYVLGKGAHHIIIAKKVERFASRRKYLKRQIRSWLRMCSFLTLASHTLFVIVSDKNINLWGMILRLTRKFIRFIHRTLHHDS